MDNQSCMRCYVSGKVQGVWYRASAKEQACRLAITGWAKNLEDGRVEVLAYGSIEKLDLFYTWLQKGPELAQVQNCVRQDELWQEYNGFDTF